MPLAVSARPLRTRSLPSALPRIAAFCALLAVIGCSPASRSPDTIRQTTAAATAAAVRDSKAVAKGVFEGLREKGPVNINKASEGDLEALPGIDPGTARRIIAGRPYDSSVQLLHRHILTRTQYDHIASKVVAR